MANRPVSGGESKAHTYEHRSLLTVSSIQTRQSPRRCYFHLFAETGVHVFPAETSQLYIMRVRVRQLDQPKHPWLEYGATGLATAAEATFGKGLTRVGLLFPIIAR